MRQVEIAGSYYELGLQYGRILAENNLNWWWKQPTESALAFAKECEREIATHAPGFLEEIRGIADACERKYDLDAAKRLCSDHEIGLCDHGESKSEPFGTIYSWVAELGTGEIHVAHGRPCENEYKVLELQVS